MPTRKEPRRFAEGTTVEVSKSRMEVEMLLTAHAAIQVVIGTDSQKRTGFVHFGKEGRQYKLFLPPRAVKKPSGYMKAEKLQALEKQAEREQWRAMLLLLKAKLEVVASELVTMEQEFMAYVVLPDGRTVGELLVPQLETAYTENVMPPLLPEWRGAKAP